MYQEIPKNMCTFKRSFSIIQIDIEVYSYSVFLKKN